jgi:hypothetical protein
MQTTSGVSSLSVSIGEHPPAMPDRELFGTMMRQTQETDWDLMIVKIDKWISRIGALVLVLSALYFSPLLLSMLLR